MLFRNLSDKEASEFKQWARENYRPFSPIQGIWHPIVQAECCLINQEKSGLSIDDFMTISDFNPDCMDIEGLDKFGRRSATDDYQATMFFNGAPDGYMTAYAHLIMYAILKSRAMELRAIGDIQGALWCEGICERIYSALPDFARW